MGVKELDNDSECKNEKGQEFGSDTIEGKKFVVSLRLTSGLDNFFICPFSRRR